MSVIGFASTREGEAPGVIAAVAVARFRRRAEASLLNQGV
jgi:hypothetical protein